MLYKVHRISSSTWVNPCAAGAVYIQFEACFRSIEIQITKFDLKKNGNWLVDPIIQYWRYLFFININIFHHLKLEIVLASNE